LKPLAGTLNQWFIEQWSKKEVIFHGFLEKDSLGRFPPNAHIHTSGVELKGTPKEGDIIETRNSRYTLGVKMKEQEVGKTFSIQN
jgi:hypothetical protein